eukprot:scaffold104553_cov18-Prasinocladus_malaysianus.AAC.1
MFNDNNKFDQRYLWLLTTWDKQTDCLTSSTNMAGYTAYNHDESSPKTDGERYIGGAENVQDFYVLYLTSLDPSDVYCAKIDNMPTVHYSLHLGCSEPKVRHCLPLPWWSAMDAAKFDSNDNGRGNERRELVD